MAFVRSNLTHVSPPSTPPVTQGQVLRTPLRLDSDASLGSHPNEQASISPTYRGLTSPSQATLSTLSNFPPAMVRSPDEQQGRDGRWMPNSENSPRLRIWSAADVGRGDWDTRSWTSSESTPTTPLQPLPGPALPLPRSVQLVQNDAGGELTVVHGIQDSHSVRPTTTHLAMRDSEFAQPLYDLLQVPLSLSVLDLSNSRLTHLPESIGYCTSLEELNISGNSLGLYTDQRSLAPLASLQGLRVLLADRCALRSVPRELMGLRYIQVLALRGNKLAFVPSWMHAFEYLDCLLLDGNTFETAWQNVVEPLIKGEAANDPTLSAAAPVPSETPSSPVSSAMSQPAETRKSSGNFLQRLRTPRSSPGIDESRRSSRLFGRSSSNTTTLGTSTVNPGMLNKASDNDAPSLMSKRFTQRNEAPTTGMAFITKLPLPLACNEPYESRSVQCFLPLHAAQTTPSKPATLNGGIGLPLRQLMAYLRDLDELRMERHQMNVAASPVRLNTASPNSPMSPTSMVQGMHNETASTYGGGEETDDTSSMLTPAAISAALEPAIKEDPARRCRVLLEVLDTEETYVAGLTELQDIYVKRARQPIDASHEPVLNVPRERAVFGHVEGIVHFHKDAFLPSLRQAIAPLRELSEADFEKQSDLSARVAIDVANVFTKHTAYFKMYMNYVNQFDSAINRITRWAETSRPRAMRSASSDSGRGSMGRFKRGGDTPTDESSRSDWAVLSPSEQRRVQLYLRRCREDPRHSQLNLDGYMLLPIQRIPRYRMLLEQLVRCTAHEMLPPDDPEALVRALAYISLVASWVNEGKRQSDQGRRLLHWQGKMRGTFSAPLVQPHRRLVCDGPVRLRRISKRVEACSHVEHDILEQTVMDQPVYLLLCNDLAVVVSSMSEDTQRPPDSEGSEPVEITAVLKPRVCLPPPRVTFARSLTPPASIAGHVLRVVDSNYVFYFASSSYRDAMRWRNAINAQPF